MTNEAMIVVSSDGGFLPQPISLPTAEEPLPLTAAERYDILIDFSKYPVGHHLYLHHVRYRKTDSGQKVELLPMMRFDIDRIDARVKAGETELWTFTNPDKGRLHPIHVHLAEVQLLERNGKPPRPYEAGWKDTFLLGEKETIKVILRFPSYQGKPIQGKYMMHCHNLDHEDNAMMLQFEVGQDGLDPVATAPALPIIQMRSWMS
jgi:spore coat protein A, manganese oxidase